MMTIECGNLIKLKKAIYSHYSWKISTKHYFHNKLFVVEGIFRKRIKTVPANFFHQCRTFLQITNIQIFDKFV